MIEQLFGQSAQSEFLKRSGDIIAFMGRHEVLTPEHVELIWKCATVRNSGCSVDNSNQDNTRSISEHRPESGWR